MPVVVEFGCVVMCGMRLHKIILQTASQLRNVMTRVALHSLYYLGGISHLHSDVNYASTVDVLCIM